MKHTIEEINNFINDIAIECASQESCDNCPFLVQNENIETGNICVFSLTPWLWKSIKEKY